VVRGFRACVNFFYVSVSKILLQDLNSHRKLIFRIGLTHIIVSQIPDPLLIFRISLTHITVSQIPDPPLILMIGLSHITVSQIPDPPLIFRIGLTHITVSQIPDQPPVLVDWLERNFFLLPLPLRHL